MKYLDEQRREIPESSIDLTKGGLYYATIVKPDAKPIDGITKFVWEDDDCEDVMIFHEYTPEELSLMSEPTPEERIAELEAALELLLSGVTE